jgi:hypothetical protein
MKTENPLQILFAGDTIVARYLDGSTQPVHVRALPLRHLHHVFSTYEHKHLFIELCCYTKPGKGRAPAGLFPDVPVPAKLWPVPAGWSENLADESIEELFRKAESLNFQRAVTWAKGQIAAKKMIAPLMEQTTAQMMPLLQQVMQPLFAKLEQSSGSPPTAPATPAAAAKKS